MFSHFVQELQDYAQNINANFLFLYLLWFTSHEQKAKIFFIFENRDDRRLCCTMVMSFVRFGPFQYRTGYKNF